MNAIQTLAHRRHFGGVAFAALFALAVPSVAAAYVGQNPYLVTLGASSSNLQCSATAVIQAEVDSRTNGEPVANQTVEWDIERSPASDDQLGALRTTTDANGRTSITLDFGSAEGTRVVRATIATFPATVEIGCTGSTDSGGGSDPGNGGGGSDPGNGGGGSDPGNGGGGSDPGNGGGGSDPGNGGGGSDPGNGGGGSDPGNGGGGSDPGNGGGGSDPPQLPNTSTSALLDETGQLPINVVLLVVLLAASALLSTALRRRPR